MSMPTDYSDEAVCSECGFCKSDCIHVEFQENWEQDDKGKWHPFIVRAPEIGEGYRLLDENSTISSGDQGLNDNEKWVDATEFGSPWNHFYGACRRKTETSVKKYRLKKTQRFHFASESFEVVAGGTMQVSQIDKKNDKVLVDFGGGTTDWLHASVLCDFEEIVD